MATKKKIMTIKDLHKEIMILKKYHRKDIEDHFKFKVDLNKTIQKITDDINSVNNSIRDHASGVQNVYAEMQEINKRMEELFSKYNLQQEVRKVLYEVVDSFSSKIEKDNCKRIK